MIDNEERFIIWDKSIDKLSTYSTYDLVVTLVSFVAMGFFLGVGLTYIIML